MANANSVAVSKTLQKLLTPGGLPDNLAAVGELQGVTLAPVTAKQVYAQNAAQALIERSLEVRYPTVLVYCEKIVNDLREKFRTFSGRALLAVEVRVSQDRIEGIEQLLTNYVDAITRVLDQNRGDWGGGTFYTGGYEVSFDQVEPGGKHFLQSARVRFQVLVSVE
jgi:hypothetical protein